MEQVRTGLRQIMSDLLRACPPEEAVSLAWPMICGKEVAARTRVAGFADGRLTVEVPDKDWQNQLQAFTSRYMAGYADFFGELVKSVRFVLRPSAVSNQHSAQP